MIEKVVLALFEVLRTDWPWILSTVVFEVIKVTIKTILRAFGS
jgi:hypothetical protein